jgi:hypothetical protein
VASENRVERDRGGYVGVGAEFGHEKLAKFLQKKSFSHSYPFFGIIIDFSSKIPKNMPAVIGNLSLIFSYNYRNYYSFS